MTDNSKHRPVEGSIAAGDRGLDRLPLEIVRVEAAGRQWTLEAVRDQDRLLAVAGDGAVFPFGVLLWESAIGLADVLAEGGALDNVRVLELGAGCGLAGLAAAALGARVVQTDHSAEALALCQRNARANGISTVTQVFGDWTHWEAAASYDLVIGADILYEPAMFDALIAVFDRTVATGGTLLLTDPGRVETDSFIVRLVNAGWDIRETARTVAALPPCAKDQKLTLRVLSARRRDRAKTEPGTS